MQEIRGHVVVGAGALGTATAYHLARSGASDVLVLEQFEMGHAKGASEDHSRIIRHSYDDDHYTVLTPDMYAQWREVERESGLELVVKTGGLDLAVSGTSGHAELDACAGSLARAGIDHELLDAADVRRRWPQWAIGDDVVGLFQKDGGIVDIRRASAAHVALARKRGAEFRPHTEVLGIEPAETHVRVRTNRGEILAGTLVLCTASWTPRFLAQLGVDWRIHLSQEQVTYFATPHVAEFAPSRFPVWIWHGQPSYYGFPVYGEVAVKAARHLTRKWVTVNGRSYERDADEAAVITRFMQRYLPSGLGPELYSRTCVYDLPPDEDFILDKLPVSPLIIVGIGAGHAAKFASLIGRILADLALDGATGYPIEAFRADRPALTDPSFRPAFAD